MPAALARRVAAGLIALVAAAAISAMSAQSEPAIWISEVSAAGVAAAEWFEISNAGDDDAVLSGWTVRDALGHEDSLPELTIPAGGSAVIAAQADESLGVDATIEDGIIGNGLANAGDAVVLLDEHGEEVDRVTWGSGGVPRARSGRTLQRSSPSAEPVMAEPTPGRAALPDAEQEDEQEPETVPLTLRISALMPNPESGKEWVELRNHGSEQVFINDWRLVTGDKETPLSGYVLPDNYQTIDYLEGELGNESGRVELFYTADGSRLLVDQIEYGTDAPHALPAPTAGIALARGVIRSASGASADASRVRIAELMPSPLSGPEWVELVNEGDEPVDLAGWQIGDREELTPLSGVIEPGGRLVIEDIGNGLNGDHDLVRLIGPDGGQVDAVEYGTAEIPAPAAGRSIALDQRWVVNLAPSRGGKGVTPALAAPIDSGPDSAGDPPAAEAGGGINPWIIVSAGLMALIAVIFLRRLSLPRRRDGGEPIDGFAGGLDQPPLDFPPEEDQPPSPNEGAHPWDAQQ